MHHLYLKLKLTDLMYAEQNDAGDGRRNALWNIIKKYSKQSKNIRISMGVPERKAKKRKFIVTNLECHWILEYRNAMSIR